MNVKNKKENSGRTKNILSACINFLKTLETLDLGTHSEVSDCALRTH